MVAIATKVTGNTVSASEFNQLPDELENVVTAGSGTPAAGTLDQVAKAMVDIAANADYYTDGGAADAYVLSVISPNKAPQFFRNGMEIRWRTTNANTGASTVNPAGLGIKDIKKQDGSSDPDAGDISDARENRAVYDGTNFRLTTELNDASATVKGLVELATDAETATATDATRPVVPSALLSLFNVSLLADPGYVRFPCNVGGTFVELIVQWGITNVNITATLAVNLPLTFPNAGLIPYASLANSIAARTSGANTNGLSTTQITLVNPNASGTNDDIAWLAIGY